MISRLGAAITRMFRHLVPEPFVIAVLLTAVTVGLALALTTSTLLGVVDAWAGANGLWGLLRFAMQMCLILVTGHAVASSPPVSRMLTRLARLPRTGPQAAALVASVACIMAVVNWGLGLIAGAIIARRVGSAMDAKGVRAHYPLLAAAGYLGLMVWHGGLSGSAPLTMTKAAGLADIFGADPPMGPIGLGQTLFSPLNLVVTGGLLLLAPLMTFLLHPRGDQPIETAATFGVREEPPAEPARDPEKGRLLRLLEDTPLVTLVLVILIGLWAWRYYVPVEGPSGALELTLDSVNLTMLLIGLILHRTPGSYLRAVEGAAPGCAGIILQFPLYAGIMGIMSATGLTALFARGLADLGGPGLLPLFTFVSACVVNLFVPSGGGQWAVQGPIAMQSGLAAGAAPGTMVMAVAYGDQLTNMLQPFWALPLLAITGVKARDLVGYTAVVMVIAGAWAAFGLLLLG